MRYVNILYFYFIPQCCRQPLRPCRRVTFFYVKINVMVYSADPPSFCPYRPKI